MAETNKVRRAKLLTAEARVEPEVADHMNNIMGMESVSDLVSFFDLGAYQEKVQTHVPRNNPACKKDKIQQSRRGSAWELARARLSRALLRTNNLSLIHI